MNKKDFSKFNYVGTIMSNFDNSIENWAEEKLKNEKVYGKYPGWHFCGRVWYENDKFHCEVWQYGYPIEIVSANNLEQIMKNVSNEYGWE